MLFLLVNPGLPEEQQFTIGRGTTTIGRTKDNAVFCLHKSLSRKHAMLEWDGAAKVKLTDLQSKNGTYYQGKRVTFCELGEGETFRCGDIIFSLESGTAAKTPRFGRGSDSVIKTLPSQFGGQAAPGARPLAPPPRIAQNDDQRFKDKLFLLIRASELCVAERPIEQLLDELLGLASQVLAADRLVLFTVAEGSLDMQPRATKSFVASGPHPYSQRIVDWVVDQASPMMFPDVSSDHSIPGDASADTNVRGALAVPISAGGSIIGLIYADSVSQADCFRPDDLAMMRAMANLSSLVLERSTDDFD